MTLYSLNDHFPTNQCGSKASNLASLLRAGYNVPHGFVIPNEIYKSYFLTGKPIDNSLKSHIASALQKSNAPYYMVRSSAIGEDGPEKSFAGQLESFKSSSDINEIIKNIYKCWESRHSETVQAYEASTGNLLQGMGVVVQELIDPDYAGVIFTRSHLKEDCGLVEYVEGHGEQLVSGNVHPVSFHYSIKYQKPDTVLPFNFTEALSVSSELEQLYKHPVDIEWAIKDHRFYLLQARPITTPVKKPMVYWSNTNVNENYPGPITPLLYSVARDAYYHYFKNLASLFQIPQNRISKLEPYLANLVGIFGCRLYYNMSSIHHVLSSSPFSSLLIKSFDDFVGYTEDKEKAGHKATLKEKLVFGKEFIRNWFQLNKQVREFEAIADQYGKEADAAISYREIQQCFHGFLEIRMHRWYKASLADFFAMVFHGILGHYCKRFYSDRAVAVHNKLIQAIPNLISSEPVIRIYRIKGLLRADGEAYGKFNTATAEAFYQWISEERKHTPLYSAIADYLNNWGYRCSGELMLTEKNYRDDPAMFIDLLKQYDQLSDVNPEKIISEKGLEQRKIIRGFKQKIWKKYGLFFPLALVHIVLLKLLVRFTMRGIASRERVRLKQALLYFKFKQILQKTGTLLHKDVGVLENPDDVLYLRYQEIAESLTASEMLSANLKNRILSRKQQYDNSSKHSYPDDFFTTLGEYTPPEKVKAKSTPLASSALEGLSACGGFVKGRARVLESVSEAWKIEKGDILITRQTDPGWVVLFPLISGLVVERGGMLSHGAIVSREFGVPAIVGVDKAMERIKDKAVIELNADTGQIVICD